MNGNVDLDLDVDVDVAAGVADFHTMIDGLYQIAVFDADRMADDLMAFAYENADVDAYADGGHLNHV